MCPFPENLNVRKVYFCERESGETDESRIMKILYILYYTFSNKIMINIKDIFMFEHFILRTRSKEELDFEDFWGSCVMLDITYWNARLSN